MGLGGSRGLRSWEASIDLLDLARENARMKRGNMNPLWNPKP